MDLGIVSRPDATPDETPVVGRFCDAPNAHHWLPVAVRGSAKNGFVLRPEKSL
jgi:hypothetical protein